MKLHELAPKIAKKSRMRRGQGNGSKGTFAGKGCKGQKARAGGGVRKGFEGGQSPLIQRMPKLRGFSNPNKVESQIINLADLEENFKTGEKVTLISLIEKKLIVKNNSKVKILGDGELTKKLEVSDVLVSKSAKEAIEKTGGSVAESKKSKIASKK